MTTLEALKAAIDQLSTTERAELHEYLEQYAETLQESRKMDVDAIIAAARVMREGLTEAEWDELEQAMNDH